MAAAESGLATRTTTRLLDALRDLSNEPAWAQIDARYRPVIAGLARRIGLSEVDAEEVAQQTLASFVREYRDGRYDRSRGRLSSWILWIARNTALHLRRTNQRPADSVAGPLPDVPEERDLRPIWDEERDRTLFERAMGMLRDESAVDDRTLQAFELVAMRGAAPVAAAAQCGMSIEQVYVAKSRVTKRLRDLVGALTAAFEEDA